MSKLKQHAFSLSAVLMVALLVLVMAISGPSTSNAAPLGAVTPVTFSNNGSRALDGPRIVTFFNGTPAAYQTPVTNCYDTRAYNTLDVIYTSASVAAVTIDQTYGNDTAVTALGAAVLASNATPVVTPVAVQIPNFNAFNCIKVSSANATPISVYVKALAK
jgi:hypothetical protein